MSNNRIYELGTSTDSLVEQIISIREYRAVNRYASANQTTEKQISGNIHGKSLPSGNNNDSLKNPGSSTESPSYHNSIASNSSSEFFDRFYIHDHLKVKSYHTKFKTGSSSRTSLIATPSSSISKPAGGLEPEKAEIYELSTHQVISLKGIRVNHKA